MEKQRVIQFGGMIFGRKYFCTSQIGCGKEIDGFDDRPSAAEYRVNHLCQKCQDRIFKK